MLSVDVIAPHTPSPRSFPPLRHPFLLSKSFSSTQVEKFGCTLLLAFFFFILASLAVTPPRSRGRAVPPPSPDLHRSSTAAALAPSGCAAGEGDLGAWGRETQGSSQDKASRGPWVPLIAGYNGSRLLSLTSRELLFYSSMPRISDVLSAALQQPSH